MKNIVLLVLALALLVPLAACGSDKQLDLGEFDLYKSGRVAASPEGEAISVHKGDGNFTTKRGIAVGSPVSDIVRAYRGVPAYIISDQRELDYAEQAEKNSVDLAAYLDAHPDRTVQCVMYELAYIGDEPASRTDLLDAYEQMRDGADVETTEYALCIFTDGERVTLINTGKYVTNKDNVPPLEEGTAEDAA